MGGSDSIRGYMMQAVVCLLDALRVDKNWHSLTLEPDRGNTQVDFVWHTAAGKRVVQVKSSLRFNSAEVKRAAEDLEAVEADAYELILVSSNFDRVSDAKPLGKVALKLIHMDAVDLKARAADALDIYLTEWGYPHTTNDFRKAVASVLTEHLLASSVDSRTLRRDELDEIILSRLLPMLNAHVSSDVVREVRKMQEFKALFNVDEPNARTRRAVMDFYRRTEMKNKHRVISDALQFLEADDAGRLTVRIDRVQGFFNKFFLGFATVLMIIPLGVTPFMLGIESSALFITILAFCAGFELFGFWTLIIVNPFIQALRIRKEIKRLGQTPPFDGACAGPAI